MTFNSDNCLPASMGFDITETSVDPGYHITAAIFQALAKEKDLQRSAWSILPLQLSSCLPDLVACATRICQFLVTKAACYGVPYMTCSWKCSAKTLDNLTAQHFRTLGDLRKWLREAILQRLNHELDLQPGMLLVITASHGELAKSCSGRTVNFMHVFMPLSACSVMVILTLIRSDESLSCALQKSGL